VAETAGGRRQAVLAAPGDEGADCLAQAGRAAAVLDGGDGHVFAFNDFDGLDVWLGGHVLAPEGA
jgi:hypothetical protein